MRSACDKVNFEKCKIISLVFRKHTIRGYHGAAALKFLVRYLDGFCGFIFLMISREPSGLFLRYAHCHAKIKLFKLSVFNFLIKHTQTFSIFRTYYDTACVAVYSVAKGRSKRQFLLRTIFTLFIKIVLYPVYECVRRTAFVLMYHKSALFVAKDNILVLVNNIQRRWRTEKSRSVSNFALEKFVIDVKLHNVTASKPCGYLTAFAVDLDTF